MNPTSWRAIADEATLSAANVFEFDVPASGLPATSDCS